jgi:hypothetical protein
MKLAMTGCGRTSALDERFYFHSETDFADMLLAPLQVSSRRHLQRVVPQSGGGL